VLSQFNTYVNYNHTLRHSYNFTHVSIRLHRFFEAANEDTLVRSKRAWTSTVQERNVLENAYKFTSLQ